MGIYRQFVPLMWVGVSLLGLSSVTALSARGQPAISDTSTYPTFLTASLRHGLDTTVSPCVDFDQYVNGGWRATTTLPKGMTAFGVFQEIKWHQSKAVLRVLLDSVRRIAATTPDPEIRVLGTYFESCLTADALDGAMQVASMYGAPAYDTSRAARCQRVVLRQLEDVLAQVFLKFLLPPDVEPRTTQMLNNIRRTAIARLQGIPWLSAEGRTHALAILEGMTFKVAKPVKTVDYTDLVLTPNDLPGNYRTIQEFLWQRKLSTPKQQKALPWEGQFRPNAYYQDTDNSVLVPIYMFHYPLFDPQGEEALWYAGVGFVIGHEVYHGITYAVRKDTQSDYQQRAHRLAAQYSALPPTAGLEGARVNGRTTLNENLADLGGLLATYEAWDRNSRASAAPSIEGFTPAQRFFVYYARMWRLKGTKEYLKAASTSSHAPAPARLNGVVMNVPAFAQAFGCKEGDPMAKPAAERANIW